MTTTMMKTTARIVVPIILVVALSLLLQGHNLPGGGFIGGVLTTVALALIYVAHGLDYLESGVLDREVESGAGIFQHRTVLAYRKTFVFGLAVVAGSGVAGVSFEEPFLTQAFVIVEDVPIYHEIELTSALVFDVGVYCVVVGGLLTILSVVGGE
ncbi:sodium:proton antiporter [Halobacteriales archaeon QS_1_68_17]|nr:MAG: sodium:proton antiporter [Halobacteriales archaeon QS_1_68_17]